MFSKLDSSASLQFKMCWYFILYTRKNCKKPTQCVINKMSYVITPNNIYSFGYMTFALGQTLWANLICPNDINMFWTSSDKYMGKFSPKGTKLSYSVGLKVENKTCVALL